MDFNSLITFIQIVCIALLLIASPIYAYLKMKWRAEAAEQAAERERQLRETTEKELAACQRALLNLQQPQYMEDITRVGPLDTPPDGVDAVFDFVRQYLPKDPYLYVFGWEQVDGIPSLVAASLHGDSVMRTGHGLITGRPGAGKRTLAFLIFWSLAMKCTLQQLRVVWIDGRSSDGVLLRGLVHIWVEPILRLDDIPATLQMLRLERQRREQRQVAFGVARWEELPEQERPPLLWIFLADVDLVALALGGREQLNLWLTAELIAAADLGIRYWIGARTITDRDAIWRNQIACFCIGGHDTEVAVQASAGMSSVELEELGGWSPLRLPGPGYFTIRIGRHVATIRTPKIDLAARKQAIAALPRMR